MQLVTQSAPTVLHVPLFFVYITDVESCLCCSVTGKLKKKGKKSNQAWEIRNPYSFSFHQYYFFIFVEISQNHPYNIITQNLLPAVMLLRLVDWFEFFAHLLQHQLSIGQFLLSF